ncbi:MAG TPA: malonyl-CoA synthase [Hyphomicrobiales bacterium]|nr:malonyl-CoA synthase [Hyphomicrobiales bacterium]
MNQNLYARFAAHFPADRGRLFLETPDGRRLSYADVEALSGRVANALKALGVKVGDRVAVHTEKSVEGLLLYLGAVRSGAVLLPLNTSYTPAELDYFLGDAEPALVVCDPGETDAIQPLATKHKVGAVETLGRKGDGTLWPKVMAAPAEAPVAELGKDDLATILYTSGTTGRSKGAMITHENLASNAEALCEIWRFTDRDRLLHVLPIFHVHGLFVATNTILMAGGSMIYCERFDAAETMRLLPRATAFMGVPTYYFRLLARPDFGKDVTAGIRLFTSGSAPLSPETHREFHEKTGHFILERYGMTETEMITSNPYDRERRPGTVGFPLPGVSIRIADPETGRLLADGEVGQVEVKGPNVFKGYWRNPEKTAAEFRPDGYFMTGDLGLIDGDGYLSLVGRAKDLIISGGLNVYPAELEALIDAVPGVAESAVIGLPHADFGEAVTAVVALKPGAAVGEDVVLAAFDGQVARFKQPKRVLFRDGLPRNTMGKIQKAALRAEYAGTYKGP